MDHNQPSYKQRQEFRQIIKTHFYDLFTCAHDLLRLLSNNIKHVLILFLNLHRFKRIFVNGLNGYQQRQQKQSCTANDIYHFELIDSNSVTLSFLTFYI